MDSQPSLTTVGSAGDCPSLAPDPDVGLAQVVHPQLFFSRVPEDILVNIFCRLEDDPGDLARLACACTRFSKVIRTICWKFKCLRILPAVVADLVQPSTHVDRPGEPPGGWASLQKLLVCCPGLWHAGVLLENWDFGLGRELGFSEEYAVGRGGLNRTSNDISIVEYADYKIVAGSNAQFQENRGEEGKDMFSKGESKSQHGFDCGGKGAWGSGVVTSQVGSKVIELKGEGSEGNASVKDPYNTLHRSSSETDEISEHKLGEDLKSIIAVRDGAKEEKVLGKRKCSYESADDFNTDDLEDKKLSEDPNIGLRSNTPMGQERKKAHLLHKSSKPKSKSCSVHSHLACGAWNLSREQGNKLLENRFRSDSLYICDWPGCIHPGAKRKYKLFRGIFKNFQTSHVWRNLKDMKAKKIKVGCAFCPCKSTWDMGTSFCLKRSIEYHDDGEPVVRAYVCDNGHVAGAWTDRPFYTL